MGQTAARAFICLLSTFPGINDRPSTDNGLNSARICSLLSQISFALYPDLKGQLQSRRFSPIEPNRNGRTSVRLAVKWLYHEGWSTKNSVDVLIAQKAVHFTPYLFRCLTVSAAVRSCRYGQVGCARADRKKRTILDVVRIPRGPCSLSAHLFSILTEDRARHQANLLKVSDLAIQKLSLHWHPDCFAQIGTQAHGFGRNANAPRFAGAGQRVMEHQPHSSKAFEPPAHCAISIDAANTRFTEFECQRGDPLHSLVGSTSNLPNIVLTQPRTTGNDAAIGIGQAYDGIHRIHATLVYLRIMNISINNSGFSPIFDEAKHTYDQALSLYEGRDFGGALEFASASTDLTQVLEIMISRALRSDLLYPSLVLLPPEHQTTLDDSMRMQKELYRVECLLSLIHRVAENGTLSEDQAQTLHIASCSENLLKKARDLVQVAEMKEAFDVVHAAAVAARAAEYICKRWYAMQGIDPFLPPAIQS